MAEAMIGGLLAGNLCRPESMWATDRVAERCDLLKSRFGVRVGSDNRAAVVWADVVVLAVKPQVLPAVVQELSEDLHRVLVISIAAGATIQAITSHAPAAKRIIRAMPNMPALVREGMTALAWSGTLSKDDQDIGHALEETVTDRRPSPAGSDVSGQGTDAIVSARDRRELRRPGSHHDPAWVPPDRETERCDSRTQSRRQRAVAGATRMTQGKAHAIAVRKLDNPMLLPRTRSYPQLVNTFRADRAEGQESRTP